MPKERWSPVCPYCHSRPKMDRSDICEDCWYAGKWSPHGPGVRRDLDRFDPCEREIILRMEARTDAS